ncbi:MAG: NUDIX domain-containing protein [Lachnospiraceae bacterium]|nr:NUDIX domain-containing protein [Lachnospiraceae bacterium]
MKNAISCGGVVIHKGKILLLYKNYGDKYSGWVLPKGSMEEGETFEMTAVREVKEETGADAEIIKYIDETSFEFNSSEGRINKHVKWFLMKSRSYFSKPQRSEYFEDSGYYKYHEAYHLLYFNNERQILEKAFEEYKKIRRENILKGQE